MSLEPEKLFKVIAAKGAPYAPAEGLGGTDDGKVNQAANEEILIIDRAVIFIQETLAGLVDLARWKNLPARPMIVICRPVFRVIETKIKHGAGVPFVASATFPSQAREVIECDIGPCVSDASAFVAFRAEQNNLAEVFGDVLPSLVLSANDFTVIAPRVGKWFVFCRLIAIKAKPGSLADQMGANEALRRFAVGAAVDCVGHVGMFVERQWRSQDDKNQSKSFASLNHPNDKDLSVETPIKAASLRMTAFQVTRRA